MIIEKTIIAIAIFPAIVAVIDPSITSISLAVIAALVVIVPIWFKYKTDSLIVKMKEQDVKIDAVIKTSDGMKDALVRATAKASLEEGKTLGVAQAETKAAVQATAEAKGAAQEKADEKLRQAEPVNKPTN